MNSHKMFEGNSKGVKNWPICAKHAIFAIELSREQVDRGKPPNTLGTKIWKTFLSVSRDWKFYPWESCEVRHENFLVPTRLEPPLTNKSPDWATRHIKIPNFEKYSKYFSPLGHWPASESQKISMWARDWGMQLDQPATESPEQGNTIFEIFEIFCKNKRLSKNN